MNFILLIYIITCSLLYAFNRKYPKIYLSMVFIPLAFIMGFRSLNVGIDTENYYELFELFKNERWDYLLSKSYHNGAETGFLCICKLFSYISSNYFDFQLAIAVFYCIGWSIFIYRETKAPIFGLALFLGLDMYFQAFNISRQMFMIMLSVLAYPLFRGDKKILPIVVIFLLAQIHTTAYLLFFILLLNYLDSVSPLIKNLLPFIFFIFMLFFAEIMNYSSLYFVKYHGYYEHADKHLISVGYSSFFYIFVILLSLLFYYKKNITYWERRNALFSIFSVMCIFYGVKMSYMDRIGLIFMPYTILTLNSIRGSIKNTNLRNLYVFGIITAMLISFYLRIPKNYSSIL